MPIWNQTHFSANRALISGVIASLLYVGMILTSFGWQGPEGSNQKLTDLSSLDGLTGVPNRRRFDEVFALEWRRSVRGNWPLSMAMIDVDDFKAFNDHYGHRAGDIVLQSVANALCGGLQRAGDFLARYGGEEFVVLLPATDLVRAAEHGERLRQRVAHLGIEHARGRSGPVLTISVGVATIFPREDGESASLLVAADLGEA